MKIKKKDLIMFILTLPIFRPMSMNFFPVTTNIYFILSIITFAYVLLEIIKFKKKLSVVTDFIIIIEGIVFVSTIVNHGSLNNAFTSVISLIYIALLINWSVEKKQSESMIHSMMIHLELCTYINFATLILKPDGFFSRTILGYGRTKEWFLGSDHYFVVWAIPAFLIAWIFKEYTGKKTRSYLLIIITAITQFISGSSTGIVGIAIFFIWMLLPLIRKLMTPFRCVVVAAILFFSIVYLQSSDFLEPIIVGMLGKDMTFTNRLEIWDNAIKSIIASPLMGHGMLYNEQVVDLLGMLRNGFRWEGATHCHCQFLQVGFKSGITGLALYVASIVFSFAKCKKSENRNLAQVATVCMFIFCIISITEVYEYAQMYMLFILPYYISEISEQLHYADHVNHAALLGAKYRVK